MLVGQSVGGYLSVATAAGNPEGGVGAVNFAGGTADYRLLPPFAWNGHTPFARGREIREPIVGEFLDKLGLPAPRQAQ